MIWAGVLAMTLIGALGAFFLKAGMDRVDSLISLFRGPCATSCCCAFWTTLWSTP